MYRILAILVCFMFLCQNAYAHPPSNINLTYSESKHSFRLIVNHRVSGRGHFINKIIVKLNGEDLQSKTYPFQNNKKVVIFSFPEPQYKKGDILSIEVTCNRTGPVTKDFSIEKILKGSFAKEASSL